MASMRSGSSHGGRRYHAAGYVGARPTFGEGQPVLEAYLLDFAGDLYGEEIEVEFISGSAATLPSPTPKRSAAQMREDCAQAARDPLPRSKRTIPSRASPSAARSVRRALDCKRARC